MSRISRKDAKRCVGPGWSKLLDKLYDKKPRFTRVYQVKEKFGTLRFYTGASTSEFEALVTEIENESASTCEQCGKKGELRSLSWMLTLCEACLKARLIELEEKKK